MDYLFSTQEVAAILNCTTRTLQNLRDRGEISFIRVGRLIRFSQEQVEEYINRQKVGNERF
jgi:excisionase family DNA binding protein